jgi:hypothetical protein
MSRIEQNALVPEIAQFQHFALPLQIYSHTATFLSQVPENVIASML